MASTAVTVQDMFSAGLPAIQKTANKALIKPQRQLPARDKQGKFVERNTGLLLTALNKIQSTLNVLVGLTKESVNIEKQEHLQDKTELRAEKISKGETDIPPEIKDEKKGPGILGSLKGAAGSLWAGMGTKTAFAGVVLALALLTKFSDELQVPLTKLAEYMRDDMIPDIQETWLDLKSWWFTKWTAVKGFFTSLKGIFTAIENWYKSYDVNNIPGLQEEERERINNTESLELAKLPPKGQLAPSIYEGGISVPNKSDIFKNIHRADDIRENIIHIEPSKRTFYSTKKGKNIPQEKIDVLLGHVKEGKYTVEEVVGEWNKRYGKGSGEEILESYRLI